MGWANTSKDGTGTPYWNVCDSNGYLKVILQSGAGAGGVAVDDAAFTVTSDEVMVIAGFADETGPDSVDEGDIGAVRMSLDRMLLVQASGRAAEDAAVAGNPVLTGGRYDAAARTLDDGDVGAVALDVAGRVMISGQAAEDAAVAGNPVMIGGRYDTAARTLENGDAGTLAVDVAGRALVVGPAAEDAAVVGGPLLTGGRYDSTNRDLDNGDVGALAVNADSQLIVDDFWRPSLQAEENANDSDKSFTVTASSQWEVKMIWVELTTTATVGNRVVTVEFQDSAADVIARIPAGAVQAASNTYYYIFAPWNADLTAFRGPSSDTLMTPLPPNLKLPASYVIRVYDSAAVDAAADDMIVQMMVDARVV